MATEDLKVWVLLPGNFHRLLMMALFIVPMPNFHLNIDNLSAYELYLVFLQEIVLLILLYLEDPLMFLAWHYSL